MIQAQDLAWALLALRRTFKFYAANVRHGWPFGPRARAGQGAAWQVCFGVEGKLLMSTRLEPVLQVRELVFQFYEWRILRLVPSWSSERYFVQVLILEIILPPNIKSLYDRSRPSRFRHRASIFSKSDQPIFRIASRISPNSTLQDLQTLLCCEQTFACSHIEHLRPKPNALVWEIKLRCARNQMLRFEKLKKIRCWLRVRVCGRPSPSLWSIGTVILFSSNSGASQRPSLSSIGKQ